MKPLVDLTLPHHWTAEVLDKRPLIAPARQFVYPQQVDEVERGALELLVKPAQGEVFLATCALGFADPAAPTGLWSAPDPEWLCAVSGGYAYMIDTANPSNWKQIAYRPVLGVRTVSEHQLLLFVGHHSILAWGAGGETWQTERLSSEGIQVTGVEGAILHGVGWDMRSDKDVPFAIDLKNGEHTTRR